MRKKQTQLWHGIKFLLLATFILGIFNGCKKDQNTKIQSEDAKSWYLKENAKSSSQIIGTNGEIIKVSQKIDWNSSQSHMLSNGIEVMSVPVTIALENGGNAKGSLMLLISKKGNTYSSGLVYSKLDDNFNEKNLTDDNLGKWYNQAFNVKGNLRFLNVDGPRKIKLNTFSGGEDGGGPSTEDEGGCIDWYMVTNFYDSEGNFIGKIEEYMYRTCPEGGGGGGGGVEYDTDEIEWGVVDDLQMPFTPIDTMALDLAGVSNAEKTVSWQIYKANGFTFKSTEKVYSIKKLIKWVIDRMEHQNITVDGSDPKGWDVSASLVSFTDQSTWYKAKCEIKFKDKRSKTRRGRLVEKEKSHTQKNEWLSVNIHD